MSSTLLKIWISHEILDNLIEHYDILITPTVNQSDIWTKVWIRIYKEFRCHRGRRFDDHLHFDDHAGYTEFLLRFG